MRNLTVSELAALQRAGVTEDDLKGTNDDE